MRMTLPRHLTSRRAWTKAGDLSGRKGGAKLNRQCRRAITRATRALVAEALAEMAETALEAPALPRYADPDAYGPRTPVGAYVHSDIVVDGWQTLAAPIFTRIERWRGTAVEPLLWDDLFALQCRYERRVGHLMDDFG